MAGDSSPSSSSNGNGSSPPTTFWGRMSATFLNPPKPKADKPPEPQPMAVTDAEKRRLVQRLDPLERRIGYIGAAIAALAAFIINLPGVINPHRLVSKTLAPLHGNVCPDPSDFKLTHSGSHLSCVGQGTYSRGHYLLELGIFLIFAVAMLVATRINRRAPLAFTALLTGLALETIIGLLALPYIVAAGWLLVRAWRSQRYGSPTAKGPPKDQAGQARSPRTSTPRTRRTSKPVDAKSETVRAKPDANKRYTPKAEQRKRVRPPT
jgi:hypothetical protein